MTDVTDILSQIAQGDPMAADQLRRDPRLRMASERSDHTLEAIALVHEAYLRPIGERRVPWQNRVHFYSAAAEAMRRILIDHARRKKAARHGGECERVELRDSFLESEDDNVDLEALSTALDRLNSQDRRR